MTYRIVFSNIDTQNIVEVIEPDERLEPMWLAAGLDVLDFNGVLAWQTELSVRTALTTLRTSPKWFKDQYEMVEGDYFKVEEFMEKLVEIATEDPDFQIEVVY